MAEYTLTLDETKSLFTPEQTTEYESYFSFTGDNVLDNAIRTAFNMKYRDYEISNGTPQGFLDDMYEVYARYRDVISAMFEEYKANGYFASTYQDSEYSETRTPDLTHTRTPNLTNTRTPDLTSTRTPDLTTVNDVKQVYSDTPDSSGVVTGNYASSVTKNDGTVKSTGNETTTHAGNETTTQTGSETTKETGTDNRTYTLTKGIPHGSVWELLKEEKRSLIDTVLSYYAPCFILLY